MHRISLYGATGSIIALLSRAARIRLTSLARPLVVLAVMSSLAAVPSVARGADGPSVPPHHAERHMKPIVNGHHVQPRQADLPRPEMSPEDAAIVDELYRELINPRNC